MKRIFLTFTIFLLIFSIGCTSFAAKTADIFDDSNLKQVTNGISDFNTGGIGGAINTVIGLLQVAGTGVSVLMVTVLGIKYMMASVGEKAEIKKQAVPIVTGAVLLFGAVNLMALVEGFAKNVVNQ